MRLLRLIFNPPYSIGLVDLIYQPPLVNLQFPLNHINKQHQETSSLEEKSRASKTKALLCY